MENRNIYKMDDVLIILSFLMLIPAAVIGWPWLRTIQNAPDFPSFLSSAPVLLGGRFHTMILYVLGAVSSQAVGRVIRSKEKQSLKILDALGYSGKASVGRLASETGFSEARVRSLAKKLSRIPALNLRMEGDRVFMGRKSASVDSPSRPETARPSRPDASVGTSGTLRTEQKDVPPGIQAIIDDKSLETAEKVQKIQEFCQAHPTLIPRNFSVSLEETSSVHTTEQQDVPPEVLAIMKDMTLGMAEKSEKIREFSRTHPEWKPQKISVPLEETSSGPVRKEPKDMPPEIQAIMKDKSLGMMQKLKKIQEFSKAHPESIPQNFSMTLDESSTVSQPREAPEKKPEKFRIILFILLIMSPLWPIALIYAIVYGVKQKKMLITPPESGKKA